MVLSEECFSRLDGEEIGARYLSISMYMCVLRFHSFVITVRTSIHVPVHLPKHMYYAHAHAHVDEHVRFRPHSVHVEKYTYAYAYTYAPQAYHATPCLHKSILFLSKIQITHLLRSKVVPVPAIMCLCTCI